jgi:cobalt-zinc-cadmium efflux system outer membrane protein
MLIMRLLCPFAWVFVALPVCAQTGDPVHSLTLWAVLDSVSSRHPLVQAAAARVRAARGARATAGALGNPMLMYQVENAPLPGRPAPPMEREAMLTATLPLEPLYQRWSRVGGGNAGIRAAEADAAGERQRVGLNAARAFYRTAFAQVGLEAARDLAGWLDTVVAYNEARVKEGVAAEADLIRSELERDRAAAEAALQEANLARARADLSTFIGEQAAPSSLLVAVAEDAPLALPETLAGDQAMATRPDIRAARERLAAAGAGVASERTGLIRQLGVTVGTKRSAGTTSLIAGVSLPFPLFDQNRGAIGRAAAERDAAAFELAAQERAGRAELVGASEAARVLTVRAGLMADRSRGASYLARADEARRIALGAYREGAIPLIQVIDAARAWGEARIAYYQILYAQHESVLALLVAEGVDIRRAGTRP